MKRFYILIFIFLLLLFPLLGSSGLIWLGIDTGTLLLFNSEENSAPSPLLTTLGVSIPILQKDNPIYWLAALNFFGTYYEYSADRALPAEIEKADTLWTLGVILDTRFGFAFSVLEDKLKFGASGGLALVFRFPLIPNGVSHLRELMQH